MAPGTNRECRNEEGKKCSAIMQSNNNDIVPVHKENYFFIKQHKKGCNPRAEREN